MAGWDVIYDKVDVASRWVLSSEGRAREKRPDVQEESMSEVIHCLEGMPGDVFVERAGA